VIQWTAGVVGKVNWFTIGMEGCSCRCILVMFVRHVRYMCRSGVCDDIM